MIGSTNSHIRDIEMTMDSLEEVLQTPLEERNQEQLRYIKSAMNLIRFRVLNITPHEKKSKHLKGPYNVTFGPDENPQFPGETDPEILTLISKLRPELEKVKLLYSPQATPQASS